MIIFSLIYQAINVLQVIRNIAYADNDHFANFLSVSLLNNKQSLKGIQDKFPLYKRNYTNINVENLLTDFENIDWKYNVINHRVSLNEAVLSLITNLTALCDKHAPMKKVPKRTSIGAKSPFSRPAVVKVVDQLELFNHSLH